MAEEGPLSGQVLGGKYLLGELLGEGGFGMVYAGQHLLLDRPQAIKLLLERYFSRPKFRERFLREARMVAALDHPHIVHIDDFGIEEQASRAYLVMPFLGGGTFHDVLKKRHRPLEMEQVVSYVEQIGSALDYAHHRGVVHLDLKPQNLLVHEDGKVLLSDFGLAHLLKQEEVEGGTSLGYGTPHYMAPEHIHGQPEKQSDVYSLGVMLYQMLVGRRPFEGSTPGAVIVKHVTEPPPPLQAWRPELPLELEVVVEKALAKQVAQRYQSAGELVVAFKDALVRAREQARRAEEERVRKAREEQTPSRLPHPGSTGILRGLRQRQFSWRTATLLLVLALLILGSAGGLYATQHLSTARTQATATANAQASATANAFPMSTAQIYATARAAADAYARFVATNGILFGFDAQHSHANPYEQILNPTTVGDLTKKWAYQTGNAVGSSPAVAGGVVYAGSDDHNVYALDAASGAKKWAYQTGNVVRSSPAVTGGVVYIGSFDGNVYALDATSGTKKWAYQTGNAVDSSPAVAGGVVYVGSQDGNVYALDAASGAKKWAYQTGNAVGSSPAVVGGVVYVGSDDYNVYALDAASGAKKWTYQTGNAVFSSPAVAGGLIYVGSTDDTLYALDAASGAKKWAYQTGSAIRSSPAVAGGVVYIGSGDDTLYAFDATSGAKKWAYHTGGYIGSSPAVTGGVVYVGSQDGNLYALDAASGAKKWAYHTGGYIGSSPAVAGGVVYVGSQDGNLYAFHLTGT